jgi:hypothetical protein
LAFGFGAAFGFAAAFGFGAAFGFAAGFGFAVAFAFDAAFGFDVALGFDAAFDFGLVATVNSLLRLFKTGRNISRQFSMSRISCHHSATCKKKSAAQVCDHEQPLNFSEEGTNGDCCCSFSGCRHTHAIINALSRRVALNMVQVGPSGGDTGCLYTAEGLPAFLAAATRLKYSSM